MVLHTKPLFQWPSRNEFYKKIRGVKCNQTQLTVKAVRSVLIVEYDRFHRFGWFD